LRWGSHGHTMASRAAVEGLPSRIPSFFREAGDQLIYLGPEPDRWRAGELPPMDEAWKYDHYIDLENVPPGALDAGDRYEFLGLLYAVGIQRPQQTVGFLPFRILEMYQRLVTGFARWRVTPDGPERSWIEARVVNDAGILGHYVVDAAQPHHTTIHFNGWAQDTPNPRGFTLDRDFHSRFESAFVNAHITYEELAPRMSSAPVEIGDVRGAIWDHVQASNALVEELYSLDQEYGFRPDETPHPATLEFTLGRLTSGAEMLRTLWVRAWEESEELARQRTR
ncbi:hypothetical protein ACFL3Z_02635, partial [Gemmatimonadota bacterium]